MVRLASFFILVLSALAVLGCGGGTSVPPATSNPPDIVDVTPLSGTSGDYVTFSTTRSGGAVITWIWNFGGSAEPNTSALANPQVRLGEPGLYDCSVTATNEDGGDTFHFILMISPSE